MFYILLLNDGRTLEYHIKDIDFYPTIKDHATDVGADIGDIVILNYSDPEYLYKVLTTSYLTINYNLDDFIRIANAVDFLGNDQILELLMRKLVSWFNDQLLLSQFRDNKTKTEDAMFNLTEGPIQWLLRSSSIPSLEYTLEQKITSDGYNMVVSNDLTYIVIWGKILPPLRSGDGTIKSIKYVAIYKNGLLIKKITKNIEFHKIIIDNIGNIYSMYYDKIDIWNYPQYKRQFYKNIPNIMVYIPEERAIGLSQNGKYLASIGDMKTAATIVEVDTDRVLATVPLYNPSLARGTIIYDATATMPSPHMNLIFFEYLPQTTYVTEYKKYNAVWIVNEATQSWIDIPEEDLLLSHSENIICAYDKNTTNKVYEINLYKKDGLNFILLANMVNTYDNEPVAVSENLLLTRTEDDTNAKRVTRNLDTRFKQIIPLIYVPHTHTDVDVNVVNIKSKRIEHQINFPSSAGYRLEEVFPGLGNTYLFLISPINEIWGKNIKLVKYRIQPYKLLNDFLVAKLGE